MTDLHPSQIDSRLGGNGLRLMRVVWFSVALVALGIFIFSLPGYLRPLGEARPIQASLEFIAVFEVISALVSLATALLSLALAGVLFWRRPEDKMALWLSFFLLGYGIVMAGPLERLRLAFPNLALNAELAQPVVMTAPFVALFALFPNGRFVPGWMRWVTLGSLGFMALYFLAPCCDYSGVSPWLSGLITLSGLTVMALVIYAQIYRYRRVSSPVERQQTKWVVYGLALFLVWVIVVSVPYAISQSLPPEAPLPWWTLLASAGWWLSLIIMPLSLTLAILRYRLFDIDVIIKRTAQYALISGAGFIVYLLAVGGASLFLQSNIELVAGIIALALVVIFFNPARQRLQAVMDRLMPYTPPPPEVLAELEREKTEKEKQKMEKEAPGRAPSSVAGWLMAARIGWLAFFAFATLALLFAIPARWAELTQPMPTTLANLTALGWPVMGYAVYSLTTEVIFTAAFLVVGLLIFARRSNDGMALFMSLTLVAFGVGNQTIAPTINALLQYPLGKVIYPCLTFAAWATFTQFPYLFPNGRYVPRWARLPALIWFVLCIPWNFAPTGSPFSFSNWPAALFVPLLVFLWGSWVVCQVYRYARVSTPVERQQTKWVIYALAMVVASIMIFFLGALFNYDLTAFNYLSAGESPTPQILAFITVFQAGARLAFLLLPLAFSFSIFRYRLWDIDIVIKRTAQYALISGAGLMVYLLAVSGTSLFIQSNNQLIAGVIVLALLVIFFNPARQRLQVVIDKLMPYTPPPPEVLAEMERERAAQKGEAERRRIEKQAVMGVQSVSPWLTVIRAGWLVVMGAAILNCILNLPHAYHAITTLAEQGRPAGWSAEMMQASLAGLGLSPVAIALWQLVIAGVMSISFWGAALLIVWRRPNDRMALFTGFFFAAMGGMSLVNVGPRPILQPDPTTLPLYAGLGVMAWTSLLTFFFLFPNGRFVPRWTRWVALEWGGLAILWNIFANTPLSPLTWSGWALPLILVANFLLAFAALVYRYRYAATAMERQQLKWMVFMAGAAILGLIVPLSVIDAVFQPARIPGPNALVYLLINNSGFYLATTSLPITLAFVLLRYRLWDVDIVIKRTVQYALISGAGFIVYLLAVGGTSLFLQQRNDLVAGLIALALLVIFFNPARQRLQVFMDRLMPYTPPPPDMLAELEAHALRADAERKRAENASQKLTTTDETRLHGPWLNVARALWIMLSAAAVIAFIVSLLIAWGEPLPSCTTPDAVCGPWQVSQEDVVVAQQLGLSDQFMRLAYFAPTILARVSFVVVGLLIFWRKSNDWVALLLSLMLMLWLVEGVQNLGAWMPAVNGLYLMDTAVFYVLPFIFPNGRFVPRWTRWVVLLTILITLPLVFVPTLGIQVDDGIFGLALVASFIPWMIVAGYAVLYRYRRVSDATERQQIKWVMTGLLSTFIIIIPFVGVATVFPPSQPSPGRLVFVTLVLLPISALTYLAISGGIAFAILRYRLYDIDIVIRRTVQYTIISALGFGAYLLVVGGTSLFLQQRNDLLAGVLALGAVVAAFVWLRPRLEAVMDKYAPLPHRPPEARPLPPAPEAGPHSTSTMTRPISRFWQRLIRMGWVALALNSLWAFGWTLFYTWEFASSPPPRIVEGLATLGISTTLYFAANAIPMTLLFISFFAVAVLMFLRLPNDRMALFTAVFFMGFSVANAYPGAPEFTLWFSLDRPHYFFPFYINSFIAWPLLAAFLGLYPDGVFVPRWMRWVAVYGFLFGVTWGLFPQTFAAPTGVFVALLYGSVLVMFGLSLFAQVYRYFKHATPLQRQQTRWMVYGFAAVVAYMVISVTFFADSLNPATPSADSVRAELITMPLGVTFALLPLAVGIAIFRYRLFEMEIIIRRTVVYGAIVGGLGVAYFGGVALLQWLSQALTGPQSSFVVVLITLGIVALFNPVRRRFQTWIDRAFYREKVDFREAFTTFAREVRTIIDLPELLRTLVNRTTELLHITHGAVYLVEDNAGNLFRLAEGKNLPRATDTLLLGEDMRERLQGGHTVSRPAHPVFPLLVPLIAPITNYQLHERSAQALIGVLALGPRLSDQAYSLEDQTLLTSLADQAGTAVYVAQLIQEKQAETQRIEEAERRLESYANSPAGRAERFAQSLRANNLSPVAELHALTQTAGTDPATAAMLEPLSAALTALTAPTLAGLADGYRYIFASQATPEVLPVGLRTLTDHLAQLDAPEALDLYRLCQQALEANSISAIVEQGLAMSNVSLLTANDFKPLVDGLQELAPAAEALRAYERVDAQQDKLAYLASAVERLTHADRAAQAELGAADRPIVQRIAANWLTVVTGVMSELQTRARLVCRLLTRHTWTGEVIAVALAIRNEGRGAALNLKVALAPAPDYTLVDQSITIDRLAAGEEAQAELRVRPHVGDKTGTTGGQFRARFVLVYADPRGPDQTENFADVVYLLALEGEFKFIPNPYVVGTPLQTGSALFCGREDVFEFIHENLVAAHQNNLVLIGQRRTGKTSLLKQLPARLGEKYVSVYLDGQSLALDPGLPNFFYSLATEIAFTLEDRGLAIGDLPDFNDSPATTFERKFLARVREALGDRHLLLLLDEFEELESAVRRGNLDVSVFGFLRHMIQHSPNLSVIFCGTHRMEELAADYWSVLFNISLYRHVAFLQQAEAFKLIQDPVGGFGMKYDDLALDKMWRVTAGHPYFLQLLCHNLVNQHNKSKRNYVTVADVNAALDEILASGEAHFIFLWTESTPEERLTLTALSRMMPLTGQANPVQVSDYLAERGVPLDRRTVSEAMHHLALRDTLRVNRDLNDSGGSETFSWQLGLLGLWVEKYKSLSRVVDEVRE